MDEDSVAWTPAPKSQARPALRSAKTPALACAGAFLIVALLSRAPRKAPTSPAPAARAASRPAALPVPAAQPAAGPAQAPTAAASGLDLVRADLAQSAAAPSVAFAEADGLQAPSDSLSQGPPPPAARAPNPRLGGAGSSAFAHWAWGSQAPAPGCPTCAGSAGALPGDLGLKRTPVVGARITFKSRCRDGYIYTVTNVTGMPIMQMDDSEVNGGEVWNVFIGPYGTGTITSKLPPESMTSVIYLGIK